MAAFSAWVSIGLPFKCAAVLTLKHFKTESKGGLLVAVSALFGALIERKWPDFGGLCLLVGTGPYLLTRLFTYGCQDMAVG
ncbi:MAG: hypothetical protein ABSF28_27185, partial [Terracidiphilus sp.]